MIDGSKSICNRPNEESVLSDDVPIMKNFIVMDAWLEVSKQEEAQPIKANRRGECTGPQGCPFIMTQHNRCNSTARFILLKNLLNIKLKNQNNIIFCKNIYKIRKRV